MKKFNQCIKFVKNVPVPGAGVESFKLYCSYFINFIDF